MRRLGVSLWIRLYCWRGLLCQQVLVLLDQGQVLGGEANLRRLAAVTGVAGLIEHAGPPDTMFGVYEAGGVFDGEVIAVPLFGGAVDEVIDAHVGGAGDREMFGDARGEAQVIGGAVVEPLPGCEESE